ncbi:MAG TPA: PilZ domain-containing protein [Polyangiaceae bacterium]
MPVPDHFRAFARRPTSLPARLQSDVLGWDLAAELVDLGLGGACVTLSDALPLGTSIRLRIEAPQLWEPLIVTGCVAWSRVNRGGQAQLGIRFEPDSANSLAVLAELVGPGGYL